VNKDLLQKMQSQFDALARFYPCTLTDYDQNPHFRDATEMVSVGSGA